MLLDYLVNNMIYDHKSTTFLKMSDFEKFVDSINIINLKTSMQYEIVNTRNLFKVKCKTF